MTDHTEGAAADRDLTPMIHEITVQVLKELDERWEGGESPLSYCDLLAVATAVGKASWRGVLRGVSEYEAVANEKLAKLPGVTVQHQTWFVRPEGDEEPDAWWDECGSKREDG